MIIDKSSLKLFPYNQKCCICNKPINDEDFEYAKNKTEHYVHKRCLIWRKKINDKIYN